MLMSKPTDEIPWPDQIFDVLKASGISLVSYLPDAGHSVAIRRAIADPEIQAVSLTTEEEGVAVNAGAWLGGRRSVLLMQSSGVGNCINMLSLVKACRFPFFTIVTMRGESAEFNPWQVPMGLATGKALELMDVHTLRADRPDEVADVVQTGVGLAYGAGIANAVLLSQRLIGAKDWSK